MRKLRFFYMEGLNSLLIEPLEAKMKATMMKSVKYFEKKYDTSVYRIDLPRLHHAIIHWCTGITQTKEAPFSYLIKNAETEVSLFIELIKNIFGKSDHTVATLLILMLDKVPEFEAETRQFVSLLFVLKRAESYFFSLKAAAINAAVKLPSCSKMTGF